MWTFKPIISRIFFWSTIFITFSPFFAIAFLDLKNIAEIWINVLFVLIAGISFFGCGVMESFQSLTVTKQAWTTLEKWRVFIFTVALILSGAGAAVIGYFNSEKYFFWEALSAGIWLSSCYLLGAYFAKRYPTKFMRTF